LGDTHCGSYWGLWPANRLPEFPEHSGVRYLNACYEHLLATLPKKIDLLVLTGDLIDGTQRKSEGCGLFSARLGDQVDGAVETLAPLVQRATVTVRLEGTPFHEGFQGAVQALDVALGVDHVDQVVDLELDGVSMNAAHHPSGGGTLYAGTGTDREALWSQIAMASGKVADAYWIVRAHRHNYIHQQTQHRGVVALPCFELATPYAKKQNYFRFQPSLGAVLFERNEDALGLYDVRPRLYDPPISMPKTIEEIRRAS